MFTIGIDPGQKGGIAFYSPNEVIIYPTPVVMVSYVKTVKGKSKKMTRSEMNLDEAVSLIMNIDNDYRDVIDCAYLEHVTAGRQQGATSMFRFGQNFGQWQGILTGLGIRTALVRPQKWKKHCGLIGSAKNGSLKLARKNFPNNGDSFRLVKQDGLAEAALIAKYGHEIERDI